MLLLLLPLILLFICSFWYSFSCFSYSLIGVQSSAPRTDDVTYKAYYQWVPFVLMLQVMATT